MLAMALRNAAVHTPESLPRSSTDVGGRAAPLRRLPSVAVCRDAIPQKPSRRERWRASGCRAATFPRHGTSRAAGLPETSAVEGREPAHLVVSTSRAGRVSVLPKRSSQRGWVAHVLADTGAGLGRGDGCGRQLRLSVPAGSRGAQHFSGWSSSRCWRRPCSAFGSPGRDRMPMASSSLRAVARAPDRRASRPGRRRLGCLALPRPLGRRVRRRRRRPARRPAQPGSSSCTSWGRCASPGCCG